MKLWASAPVIGLSIAALAVACSDNGTNDNQYMPTGGSTATGGNATGGSGMTTGGTGMTTGGTGTPTAGTSNPTGGTGNPTAGTGGTGTAGGNGGTAPVGGTGGGTGGTAPGAETKVACPANVLGHCSMGVTYPPHPGFTLALVEDFPEPLDLNADPIWTWSDGSPADGQTEFEEDNITFAGGKMIITADQKSGTNCMPKTTNAACIDGRTSFGEALDPQASATIGKMGVASGELRTKYNNFRYGYYEVKFSAPIANPGGENTDNMSGDFLSTMFVFRTPKNVKWNEIDIELEPNHHNMIAGNAVNATGAVGYPGGNASPFVVAGPANYLIHQEHVYAFSWMPDKIEWFCDGMSIHSFAGSGADPISTLSSKIMMNLWIFSGTAFGDGVNNKYPFHATYDYFHFYKADSEVKYPCTPTPGCLDAADKTKSAQNNPKEMNYGQ